MFLQRLIPWLGAIAIASPGAAQAAIFTVGARTEAQAYQIPSWQGRAADDPRLIGRYRVVQSLDLGAYDLTRSRGTDRLDFVAFLRLTDDFGLSGADRRRLDDVRNPEVDLFYGYLQWTGVLNGLFDFRLGRQLRSDALSFYSFDGLDVQVHTPAHVGVGLLGGWLVKGTSLAGSATFAPDGVRVSDRRRIDAGTTTDLLAVPANDVAYAYLDAPSPLYGARLELEGVPGVHLLASYRRAVSKTSGSNLDALPEAARGYQTELEHAGVSGRLRVLGRSWVYASADRDLFRARWAALRAGVRSQALAPMLAVTAEAARYNPTFSADSIWNLFATGARDEYELRVEVAPAGPFRIYGGPLFTVYHLGVDDDFLEAASGDDDSSGPGRGGNDDEPGRANLLYGGYAGISTRAGLGWRFSVDGLYQGGPSGEVGDLSYLGHELWITATAGKDFHARHALDLRLSVANVSDPYQAGTQNLWSFGAALLGRARLSDAASLLLIAEENVNRFRSSDLRGYAVLDIQESFR